ncbi:hypothetical protein EON81_03850 [bacterium]|nr:MAG: hypothetical protein EON81_03850 [bacterium]
MENQSGASRRDFLKLAGGALGGVMLGASVGCGGSGGSGGGGGVGGPLPGASLPNGYTFYRVFTPGGSNSLFPDLQFLSGGVMNNDASIVLHGTRTSGQNAAYSIQMDYSGDTPAVTDSAVLASEGDTQAGFQISRLISVGINNGGSFGPSFGSTVLAVETLGTPYGTTASNAGTPLVLVNPYGGGFQKLVGHFDAAPGGGNFGAHLGDVAIDENNNVLVSSDFSTTTQQGIVLSQGLFYLPNGQDPSTGQLLTQTAATGSTDSNLPSRFGRLDLDNSGNYVVQAFAADPSGLRDAKGGALIRSGVMGGTVGRAGRAPELLAGTLGQRRGRDATTGNVYMGPRIRNNVASVVTHTTDDAMTLAVGGTTLASTGGTTPNGNTIISVNPASVSTGGLVHYLVTHATGVELIVSNGTDQKTILNYDDNIQGTPVKGIVHGFHSHQSDSAGRIVFVGEFADGTQSVIVGVPV